MSASGEQIEPVGLIAAWRSKLLVYFAEGGIARTLARGAVWSIAINVGGYALALVVQVVLTRSLGQVQYGNYAYALACMNTALLFGKLELDTSALRFVGMYDGARNWSLLSGFLARAHQLVRLTSFGVAAIAALFIWLFAGRLTPVVAASLWAACALLPVTALVEFKARCVQAFKRVAESLVPSLLLRPLLFGTGVVLATFVFHVELTAPAAISLNLCAAIVAFLIISRYLRAAIPAEARTAVPSYEAKQWMHTAAGLLVIAAAQLVLGTQMDVVVIGSMLGPAPAGLYQVASQLASIITFGITALIYLALAMISDLHARGHRAELQHLVTILSLASLVIALGAVAVLAIAGTTILGLFGPTFRSAYTVLLVLSSASFMSATVGILAGFLLSLTGHQRQAAIVVVGSAILNLTLSLIATHTFGAIGTASATAATTLLRSALLAFYCWKLLGIRIMPFGVRVAASTT
ncbi:MAG TPA: oligosaccharide flippase family protein [Gemmatimonadaceae bacterium]|nr:oligosaccharide flippase family protein [Gemmatimonadaceae bacterium]